MNKLLLSEIQSQEKDLLQMLVMLEEYIFQDSYALSSDSINLELPLSPQIIEVEHYKDIDCSLDVLEDIITQCQAVIAEIDSPLTKAEVLINELYFQHLFIDSQRNVWPVNAFRVASSLNRRLMSPIIKAAFITEIINACGFETDIIFVPNNVMVRICCDDQFAIVFDPVTGESLDWHELDLRLDDLDGDPSEHELVSMKQQAILVEHLCVFKNALIKEQAFDKALRCVDILVSLNPDDPLQRRDRGFLLHQLDCFKVAVDDYRYFVEQCPKDPAAQLLKLQLDNFTLSETIFH